MRWGAGREWEGGGMGGTRLAAKGFAEGLNKLCARRRQPGPEMGFLRNVVEAVSFLR